MDFCIINKDTLPQVMDLWDYCFEKQGDPFYEWYFSEYCIKENTIIGGFEEKSGKLLNMLHLNPYTINLRGIAMQVPYIVGVATAPEARGQHLFAPLLDMTFSLLRAQNHAFVLLMPIYAGIYLSYGFDYCYYRHRYTMPLSALPTKLQTDGIKLQRISLQAVQEILANLYNEITLAYNGVAIRDTKKWKQLLTVYSSEQMQVVIAYHDGSPVGYMIYKIVDNTFTVHELLNKSFFVKNALLSYAKQHLSEATQFEWLAEENDKAYLHITDQQYAGRLQPFMMARCIDARKALTLLPIQTIVNGTVNLLIVDKNLLLNNELLKLQIANGQIQIENTMELEDVELDISAFTQLYFGQFTIEELQAEGRVKIKNNSKIKFLEALFPKCSNYINEYF